MFSSNWILEKNPCSLCLFFLNAQVFNFISAQIKKTPIMTDPTTHINEWSGELQTVAVMVRVFITDLIKRH